MAAPHESNVVHVLSVQTTTAGVSTVTGSIYALDFRHMFMIHRRYHKLTDFSHTRNSNHLRPDGPSHVCSARSLWGHARSVSYEGFAENTWWLQGWIVEVSHTGEDQIDVQDISRQCSTMGSHYDLWSWWWGGHWTWHWPSAPTAMIAFEIQTSFNLQVSSFKPTRFLAIWFVNICDGSWWIIKLDRLGWDWDQPYLIHRHPCRDFCKVPLLSDKVLDAKTQFRWGRPKGGSAEKTILCSD